MTTQFQLQNRKLKSSKADVLVGVIREAYQKSDLIKELDEIVGGGLLEHLARVDFQPSKGGVFETAVLGASAGFKRLVLVGMRTADGGDASRFSDSARVSEAAATGVRTALAAKPKTIDVVAESEEFRGLGLGLALGAYRFEKHLSKTSPPLSHVELLKTPSAASKTAFALGVRLAEGVCLARDLINEPPNVLTPEVFADHARRVAKKNRLTAKILNHAGIKKAGMNLHDAVGKGSENEPYFIHLTYQPPRPEGKLAFVGKGLTFDSGGICIKPAPGMGDMKSDMSGGAAVLGLMEVISALDLPIEVHGIIGAAENMLDAKAYRPSDVIFALNGKGVEVINTDAEGRLVLADALTYAARLKPDFIVDAATLTGATLLSLGPSCSAYFTPHQQIADAMSACAGDAGESFWRMPLIEELAAQLKSSVTDLQHTGERMGGAITAALFLREFTEGVPWMHCDIPGAVYRDRPSGLHPKGGTGHSVLTFVKLVEAHAKSRIVSPAPESMRGASAAGTQKKAAPRKKASSKTQKKSNVGGT